MTIDVTFGTTVFQAVPFREFSDYDRFMRSLADRIVPGRQPLNRWNDATQTWEKPALSRPIRVRTALQCVAFDRFGNRDPIEQTRMLARIASVAGLETQGMRKALQKALPPAEFPVQLDGVLSDEDKVAGPWTVYGEAEFEHFVLRAPGGRITDWALMTVPVDFVLSKSRNGGRLAGQQTGSEVVERVFAFIKAQNGGVPSGA